MARTRWPPDWEPWPLVQARQNRDGTAGVLIELTASGRVAGATIRQAVTDLEHRALDGLPADAVACLRTALQALTEVSS